jgi:HEAT repeat protein
MVVGLAEAQQPSFWRTASVIAFVLLTANILLVVLVHGRRIRQWFRGRRARWFEAELATILDQLQGPPEQRDPDWLRSQFGRFDELERPIAATRLIERLRPASDEEREHTLAAIRDVGAVDGILRSTRRWMPWRRALALRTLGWLGADEAVPEVLEHLDDRSRHVRETAVRALGRIGDQTTVEPLGELFRVPGRAGPGVVYDALVELGGDAATVFTGALRSDTESVRVASCFGVASLCDPPEARPLLEPLLADPSPRVRAAAAESLGRVGGRDLPDTLARASRDEEPTVRAAAAAALGSFDDPDAVGCALNALLDADRDVAIRAAESLVRLSRAPEAGSAATEALAGAQTQWPVERARVYASLGVV